MNPSLLEQLKTSGQEHLARHLDHLPPDSRRQLEQQLEELDLRTISELSQDRSEGPDWGDLARRSEPPPAIRLDDPSPPFTASEARTRGEQLLRDGKVAAILVAGGQGSRLGFDHPKGMFPIGPVSGHSLFQILIERVRATSALYGAAVPLLVMTSPATHEETVAYLEQHDRFGLPAEDLLIFCQGTMPAVDAQTGRLLLATPDSLALAPDGHGGMLAALKKSGVLQKVRERGIEYLSYGQIDNPLVQICRPELLGYHALAGSEMTTQVVRKTDPLDKVGNVVMVDGETRIIEYSDLPDEAARERDSEGELKIWAGSIAVHVFDTAFLDRVSEQAGALPFHTAHKKVPYVDSDGNRQAPTEPNAIKFERFIFDLLPSAANAIVVEGDPDKVFAPVKNAEGASADTPTTCRQKMIRLHQNWLRAAGAAIADDVPVEISPLWALDQQQVEQRVEPPMTIDTPTFLC